MYKHELTLQYMVQCKAIYGNPLLNMESEIANQRMQLCRYCKLRTASAILINQRRSFRECCLK